MKNLKYAFILVLITCLSCEEEDRLTGNYATCYKGLYMELSFKSDSMRLATNLDYLSGWSKFKAKDNKIYHLTFGGGSDSTKAIVKYLDKGGIQLYYPSNETTFNFDEIKGDIDLKLNGDDFWSTFNERKVESGCYRRPESEQKNSN